MSRAAAQSRPIAAGGAPTPAIEAGATKVEGLGKMIAAHVIARAAYSVGVPLWEGTLCDELRDQKQRAAE